MRSIPYSKATAIVSTVAAASVILGSCAYFNTLYNARKIYAEAEEMRKERGGEVDRNVSGKYDEVIKKCSMIIKNYPNSRWVDDAQLPK